jgi:hypothetical protein
MAEAAAAADADGGLGRLQAFLELVSATRERVSALGDEVQARADQAVEDAARVSAAGRLVDDALAARIDALTALQHATGAELAALATAATEAAQQHAAEEATLAARGTALTEAVAAARADLEDSAGGMAAVFDEAERVMAELERAAAAASATLAAPVAELEMAERVVAQADGDLQAELADAQHEVAALLGPALSGLLAGHRASLDDRALPYVSESLDGLEKGAARAFHELAIGYEASATSLAREAATALAQRHDAALEAAREHEALSREVEAGGVAPVLAAGERGLDMLDDAAETAAALAALAPRLGAARDVAQQVDDLLDSLNPLD